MNFRRLRYFVVIAECQNFHRAAERLHIAQPSLTRHMNELEAELGVQLLERLPRGVRPTAFGRMFLADAKRILADVNDLYDRARCVSQAPSGKLRTGFDDSVAQNNVLAKAAQIMRDRFPQVSLDLQPLSETHQVDLLKARDIDVGFAYDICGEFTRHADIECHIIQNDDMVAVLRTDHPLARRDYLRLVDLRLEPVVMIAKDKAPRLGYQHLLDSCHRGGLDMNIVQEVASIDALFGLVSVGVGVSLVARHVRDVLPVNVVLRPVADLKVNLALSLMWRKASPSLATQRFVEIVKGLAHPEPPLALVS